MLKIENKSPLKFLNLNKVNYNYILLLIILAISILSFDLGVGNLLEEFIKSDVSSNTEIYFGSLLHLIFLAPICEEIFFRGIIFQKLKNVMPLFIAIIIQSFIFGIFHGAFSGHLIQSLLAMLSGIIYSLLYNHTNNLTISILLHIFHNLLLVILNLSFFDFNINSTILIGISLLFFLLFIILFKYNENKLHY